MIKRSGAYALIRTGTHVLAVRYGPPDGRWALPGGGIESGEHAQDTVTREVREETGLNIAVGPLVSQYVEDVTDQAALQGLPYTHKDMLIFRCRVAGGALAPESLWTPVQWVPIDYLGSVFPATPSLLHALRLEEMMLLPPSQVVPLDLDERSAVRPSHDQT